MNHPSVYMRAEIARVKRNAQQKISDVIIKVIIFALIGLTGLMLLVFASITLGLWLNSLTNSSFLGFLMVTGCYALVLGILLLIKDQEKITNKLFGFARRAVTVEPEASRLFEHQLASNGHGTSHMKAQHQDKQEEVYSS